MPEQSNPPVRLPRNIGLVGGGVIGGGWAARFLLNGVDVRVYDPAPNAQQRILERVAKARTAWRKLTQVQLPREGSLKVVDSLEQAVHEVEFVQENAPEK